MEISQEIKGKYGVLRGVLHQTEAKNCFGCVVIIHGYFSSTKLGPARLYVQLARMFSSFGFDVLRFDCYGVGDSDGKFTDSTPKSRMDDFLTIIEKAKDRSSNIILVGHSMGSSMAVRIAEKVNISKLFLLSPSFGKLTWKENLFNQIQIDELKTTGDTIRKALNVNQEFIGFLEDENVLAMCERVDSEVYMFYGLEDEFYSRDSINNVVAKFKKPTLIEIEGGDHNFINNKSREIILNRIENGCQQWLKRQ